MTVVLCQKTLGMVTDYRPLDILKHLQSPEAEKVKEIIAEEQKRIKN
ncbi:MAG: hypothetical protein F6J96_27385 [Symploca sp. SIO1C2]|nr:hypothetical protein [Symploca sp. SIO1C2]